MLDGIRLVAADIPADNAQGPTHQKAHDLTLHTVDTTYSFHYYFLRIITIPFPRFLYGRCWSFNFRLLYPVQVSCICFGVQPDLGFIIFLLIDYYLYFHYLAEDDGPHPCIQARFCDWEPFSSSYPNIPSFKTQQHLRHTLFLFLS